MFAVNTQAVYVKILQLLLACKLFVESDIVRRKESFIVYVGGGIGVLVGTPPDINVGVDSHELKLETFLISFKTKKPTYIECIGYKNTCKWSSADKLFAELLRLRKIISDRPHVLKHATKKAYEGYCIYDTDNYMTDSDAEDGDTDYSGLYTEKPTTHPSS